MEIIEISKEKYNKTVIKPFSKFETVDFIELNSNKVEATKYLLFRNNRNRFAFVGGIKNNSLLFPFSATYSIFSEITKLNSIEYYYDAIKTLVEYAKKQNCKKININTPALSYDYTHITKFQNALINNNFRILNYNLNFEYYLKNFDENYLLNIKRNAHKNYNNALKHELIFEKTHNIKDCYEIISINRKTKGYPLRMTYEEVVNTSKVIPSDFFLIKTPEGIPCASAVVHLLQDFIVRVLYWGNIPESDELRPINFLSYNIFKYYKEKGMAMVDIGISTENGVPNIGLCNFKESIGCNCSPKIDWIWEE